MLIDSHAHLTDKQFDADRGEVLERAWAAGIEAIVLIGAPALAETDPRLFVAVGIHPHDAHRVGDDWCSRIKSMAQHPKVVAIGEIGIDFYYKELPHEDQFRVFRQQIELAHELALPIIIHDREAHDDVWRIIQEVGVPPRGGIFHCFSADVAFAQKAIAAGFLISVAGNVTYKKTEQLAEVVRTIPLEHLIVETDSPYLAPVPHRGKRNEPAFVLHTAEKVAELKGISLDEVARCTTKNVRRLLRLGEKP